MKIKDFKVLKCKENCLQGKSSQIYYIPEGFMTEKEIQEEFNLEISKEGKVYGNCDCGSVLEEINFSDWNENEIIEVLSAMIEDNNKHSLTKLPRSFSEYMKVALISENERTIVMRKMLEDYSEKNTFV